MSYYRVEFGGLEPWLWFHHGNLPDNRANWTQQPDHWTLFFLEHEGGLLLRNRAYPYQDGSVALVGPGMKASFLRVGDSTPHYAATFGIAKRIEVVALPFVSYTGSSKEVRRQEFADADRWLTKSIGRALACVYNLLWSAAESSEVLRTSGVMYDFEQLVTQRLASKLNVQEIAEELRISQSQLLRLVRADHGLTVQAFIKEKRTEVAKNLIVSTDLPLKVIGAQVGLPDLHHFNKAIRTATGLSPRALRSLAQHRTPH